ncbi:reverse transcriptase domain-containing protein [Bacillus atrophaeus]|uniref:reverse transcriptase domain-containing protein n=1 Tax=Bacillus atrophaeus TaxID=1452 RepID=UPI0031BBAD53
MVYKLNIELQSNLEDIKQNFKNLSCFEDVALLLEVPKELLWKVLIKNKGANYKAFKLKKKNGSERVIFSPTLSLSILQKKLAYILESNYKNHSQSYGFVKGRGIVDNAQKHLNKKYVLNFDLENFFESITFRRVRSMFMTYYKFNEKVATTLANICCHPNGFLPQGAATSPIISNIICNRIDKEFSKLAKNNRCQYTRYADDITFSTSRRVFPPDIAYITEGSLFLNNNVISIVEYQGFKINKEKTRLQNYRQNQTVTGITVNEKLNVKRSYVRRIRSILHCIEKNVEDLQKAEQIFKEKYPFRQKKHLDNINMFAILKGMISHVGHVKGKDDPLYLKLAKRFNKIAYLSETISPFKLESLKKFHETYTYIIDYDDKAPLVCFENDKMEEILYGQGTGFLLKGVGLITNAHVIEDAIEAIKDNKKFNTEYGISFFRGNYPDLKYKAKVSKYDLDKDIAILDIKDFNIDNQGYEYNIDMKDGQKIELIGYPDYKIGQEIKVETGHLKGIRKHRDSTGKLHSRREISAIIYGGNSGGPIINESNEVIGVAVKGATLHGVSPSEIIPIKDVINLNSSNSEVSSKIATKPH